MQKTDLATTFQKGLQVLRCYQDGSLGLSLADIARRTGFDRAVVRRLCLTLVQEGLMMQSGRLFLMSPRVVTFAGSFLQANDFGHGVQPVLNHYSEQLGAEVSLYVLDTDRALCIAQSSLANSRVSLGMTIGSALPLLPTAAGRMLLARLPPNHLASLLVTFADDTFAELEFASRAAMTQELVRVSQSGVAIENNEYEQGICGVAVGIRSKGVIHAALGTSFAIVGTDHDKRLDEVVAILKLAAASLSRLGSLANW